MGKFKKLIEYRKKAGISQREMERLMHYGARSYEVKENGKVGFTWQNMRDVRNILSERLGRKLTIDELFFSDEGEENE